MNTYQPYTYLIGWSKLDQWYYGVRFAKNCNPSDLWTKYFTSSKYVALIREQHGDPDVIQIRRTFTSAKQAVLWEDRVLRHLNVTQNLRWINRNIAGHWNTALPNPNPLKGKTYAELYGQREAEWKEKQRLSNIEFWKSESSNKRRAELTEQNKNNPAFTTLGREPHNKIKTTFDFTCEFCNKSETRRDLVTQRKRKTCGSKSCAARWTHKYR
jgi:hypothetical protein